MKVRISMCHHPNFVKVENTSPVMHNTNVYLQYWSLPSCNENSGPICHFASYMHANSRFSITYPIVKLQPHK